MLLLSHIQLQIDTIDNQLADSYRMGLMTGASVIGSVVIITM